MQTQNGDAGTGCAAMSCFLIWMVIGAYAAYVFTSDKAVLMVYIVTTGTVLLGTVMVLQHDSQLKVGPKEDTVISAQLANVRELHRNEMLETNKLRTRLAKLEYERRTYDVLETRLMSLAKERDATAEKLRQAVERIKALNRALSSNQDLPPQSFKASVALLRRRLSMHLHPDRHAGDGAGMRILNEFADQYA